MEKQNDLLVQEIESIGLEHSSSYMSDESVADNVFQFREYLIDIRNVANQTFFTSVTTELENFEPLAEKMFEGKAELFLYLERVKLHQIH